MNPWKIEGIENSWHVTFSGYGIWKTWRYGTWEGVVELLSRYSFGKEALADFEESLSVGRPPMGLRNSFADGSLGNDNN